MKAQSTKVGKVARFFSRLSMAIGIVVIAAVGITCIVCLVIGITDLVKEIMQ